MIFDHTKFNRLFLLAALIVSLILSSCDDDDPPASANVAGFESTLMGIDADEQILTININFTSAISENSELTIDAELYAIDYGIQFETDPAMSGNTIVVPVQKGSSSASFQIVLKPDATFTGEEQVTFSISDTGTGIETGERSSMVVKFSKIIAEHATMNPNVGGQQQPNRVFVDLSANRQIAVDRSEWDLAFYTEPGQFRVILNSASSMLARMIDKTDLASVTAQDTIGFGAQLSIDGIFGAITSDPVPAWVSMSSSWIDAPSGDMTKTAIAEISGTASENNVYIINRGKKPDGTSRGWKKIRVTRNGNDYTLEHADINSSDITTTPITRDDNYVFNYVKFERGELPIEPAKEKWDIAFTVFTNTTPVGPALTVPYVFSDIVIQNRYNTRTAELLTANVGSYEEFDGSDIPENAFGTSQINIGSKWRSGGGPGSGPALREDRFYLVEDSEGNLYKLKFTALTQGGERGRPQIQFDLLRSAE